MLLKITPDFDWSNFSISANFEEKDCKLLIFCTLYHLDNMSNYFVAFSDILLFYFIKVYGGIIN